MKELGSFIEELDAKWERDGLDWAPELLKMLREFTAEASKPSSGAHRLESLHAEIHAYFKKYKFLKGICFVLGWVDMLYEAHDSNVA